jgi:ferredoxin
MAMETGLIHGESVLLIDLETCTRCDDCVRACEDTHAGTPRFIREGLKYKNWLVPTSWYSELIVGMQNADGPQMTSFLGNADTVFPGGQVQNSRELRSSGDLMYNARLLQSWDYGDSVVTQFGMSGAVGPNAAGASTGTSILGADLKIKWQPPKNDDGWPFVIWQTEALRRNLGSDTQSVDPDGIPASGDEYVAPGGTTHDTGGYTYLLWGFERDWIAGLRYELATASGPSAFPREDDPLRDDRQRISPLLIWQPTHFSRVSLQYNLDFADTRRTTRVDFLRHRAPDRVAPGHKY